MSLRIAVDLDGTLADMDAALQLDCSAPVSTCAEACEGEPKVSRARHLILQLRRPAIARRPQRRRRG
jgi:hypothetical protein